MTRQRTFAPRPSDTDYLACARASVEDAMRALSSAQQHAERMKDAGLSERLFQLREKVRAESLRMDGRSDVLEVNH